jgi:dolichol-phosphate mannosyltransferase
MSNDPGHLPDLTVILPTLNEAPNLTNLIPKLFANLQGAVSVLKVLVVDDGSTDDTKNVIIKLQSAHQELNMVHRENQHPSLPNSIQDGIQQCNTELIAWMDADGSMQPEVLANMIESWKTCSNNSNTVVIASRFIPGGGMKGMNSSGTTSILQFIRNVRKSNETLLPVLASWCLNKVYYRLLRGYCHDSTSGFILGPRLLLNQVSLSGGHGAYFPGMLEQLRRIGAQVVEVPYIIQLRQHGASKASGSLLRVFRGGLPYIQQIMQISGKQLKARFVSK